MKKKKTTASSKLVVPNSRAARRRTSPGRLNQHVLPKRSKPKPSPHLMATGQSPAPNDTRTLRDDTSTPQPHVPEVERTSHTEKQRIEPSPPSLATEQKAPAHAAARTPGGADEVAAGSGGGGDEFGVFPRSIPIPPTDEPFDRMSQKEQDALRLRQREESMAAAVARAAMVRKNPALKSARPLHRLRLCVRELLVFQSVRALLRAKYKAAISTRADVARPVAALGQQQQQQQKGWRRAGRLTSPNAAALSLLFVAMDNEDAGVAAGTDADVHTAGGAVDATPHLGDVLGDVLSGGHFGQDRREQRRATWGGGGQIDLAHGTATGYVAADSVYEPTLEQVQVMATTLGIDPFTEGYLCWIARQALMQPLPPPWKPYRHKLSGTLVFYNQRTTEVRMNDPSISAYRAMVRNERFKRSRQSTALQPPSIPSAAAAAAVSGTPAAAMGLPGGGTVEGVHWDLSDRGLGNAECMAAVSNISGAVTSLSLSGGVFSLQGLCTLMHMLSGNRHLTSLDLSSCPLLFPSASTSSAPSREHTDIGALAVARCLETNTSLRSLNLACTGADDGVVLVLAAALKQNKTVTEINLRGNRITEKGIRSLHAVITARSVIHTLLLEHNPFPEALMQALGFSAWLSMNRNRPTRQTQTQRRSAHKSGARTPTLLGRKTRPSAAVAAHQQDSASHARTTSRIPQGGLLQSTAGISSPPLPGAVTKGTTGTPVVLEPCRSAAAKWRGLLGTTTGPAK